MKLFIKNLGKRLQDLFIKLISMKGLFFILCFILCYLGHLEGYYFFGSGCIILGLRSVEKFLPKSPMNNSEPSGPNV